MSLPLASVPPAYNLHMGQAAQGPSGPAKAFSSMPYALLRRLAAGNGYTSSQSSQQGQSLAAELSLRKRMREGNDQYLESMLEGKTMQL